MYNQLFRIALLFLSCLLLQGCGFKPLNSIDGLDLKAISITETKCNGLSKVLGWEFNKILEMELLGGEKVKEPRYKLSTTLNASNDYGMIQRDTTISRYNTKITLDYVLTDIASNKTISKGRVNLANSFDAAQSPFSNYVSEKSSSRLLLENLSYNLRHRLYVVKK